VTKSLPLLHLIWELFAFDNSLSQFCSNPMYHNPGFKLALPSFTQ
jgi:hypothetical protein